MTRMRGFLGQWGLLAVGLLAAALLALWANPGQSKHAPAATLPAGVETYHGTQVYAVAQVLVGVCLHPELWTGRTILVQGDESNVENGYLPPFYPIYLKPPPCTGGFFGRSEMAIYDYGESLNTLCNQYFPCDVEDPRIDPLNNQHNGTPPGPIYRIYRTTLTRSSGCGMAYCLLAEGARLVSHP